MGGVLLCRGAEADLVKGRWQGLDAVYKVRRPLRYRLRELDDAIRSQRTVREAEMLSSSKKAGVRTPFLYYLDPPESTLVMEYIAGPRMKQVVDASPGASPPLFRELGRMTARLHSAGIMHGDLTTANVVVNGGSLVLLDFGLSSHSSRVEDHAVDLRLVKETVMGAHPEAAEKGLRSLFEGYSAEAGEPRARQVMKQLKNIESRGRYARVE